MKKQRPYIRKTDLLMVFSVLAVSAAGFITLALSHSRESTASIAEIRVNTEVIETIDLTKAEKPYEITVEGNIPVTLEISREGVRFVSSACPDKLCIHSGLIEANESAACLPAGVSVAVKGEGEPEVDGVVG